MNAVKIIFATAFLFFAHSASAQSDDYSANESTRGKSEMKQIQDRIDRLEAAIIARLEGEDKPSEYDLLSLDMMISMYECMYEMKPLTCIYYENLSVLELLYEGEELEEEALRLNAAFEEAVYNNVSCQQVREIAEGKTADEVIDL